MDAVIMIWGWTAIDNWVYKLLVIMYFIGRIISLYRWHKDQKIIEHLMEDGDSYIAKKILEKMMERNDR